MIVGRFAPSPTGPLHTGSLVAAVGSYVMAKGGGGRWLLRMEDLDTPRVVPGCADDILRTLESLGFEWDGEVLYQSRRHDLYQKAFERLVQNGAAYPCGCSRAEISRASTAPHDGDGEIVYPGICRSGLSTGKRPRAWRARVPEGEILFDDLILGTRKYDLSSTCGDFIIKRADGLFAYQLAVVVDDDEQGVNQVVRGSDLLSSTPRQILLQRLLGYAEPAYGHLPLMTNPGGGKLSKRDHSVSSNSICHLHADGARLLYDALLFLGQCPPVELQFAPPAEVLGWGVMHFDVSSVRARALILSGLTE